MPFFDLQTYTANLRRHIASSNALLFALAFDTTATYLASATTTARLSIFSLSQIASAPPSNLRPPTPIYTHDLSRFGVINSLHTVSQSLYIATDKALLRLAWDHLLDSHSSVEHPPDVLCQGVQVNALAAMPDQNTIIIATANGHFLLAKNSASHLFPIARPIGSAAYPHCLAADPIHSDTFLAGCDDGVIRQYNINHKNPLQGEIHLKPPTNSYSTKPYITSIVINDDATFAMAADSSYRLSVIYLATGTVVSSTDTPFLPQALVFSNGSFYCGGSDRQNFKYSSVPHSLLCLDLQCHQKAITPVSASAVYAMASSATGMIAAGGYSPYTDNQHSAQCIDVYSIPPLRSFSIPI